MHTDAFPTFGDHGCCAVHEQQETSHGEVTSFCQRTHTDRVALHRYPIGVTVLRISGASSCLLPSWTSSGCASSSCKPGKGTVARCAMRKGRRRRSTEWFTGWTVDRKERSIFTSLLLCMCAQQGRRALRLYPPFQASSSRSLLCTNQWQRKKVGEEETEREGIDIGLISQIFLLTVRQQCESNMAELKKWAGIEKKNMS